MMKLFVVCVALGGMMHPLHAEEIKHRFLAADSSQKRVAIIGEDGSTEWEMKIGPLHDLHMLANGHVLLQTSWTRIAEVDPKSNSVVWEYDAALGHGNSGKKIEVHSFQRLDDNRTLIAESGSSRILEVGMHGDALHQFPLIVSQSHPHRDTRLVRKLTNGNYLVCHEGDGMVKEYSSRGALVWEFQVPLFGREPANGHGPEAFGNQCFSAVRLANGNTMMTTGNGHRVLEVSPDKRIVWQLENSDLPKIQLAWLTTLQILPSGNLVIGNCHAGEANPQIIEVTRDKQIVWSFRDFSRFGNALTNTQILSTNGSEVRAVMGQDR